VPTAEGVVPLARRVLLPSVVLLLAALGSAGIVAAAGPLAIEDYYDNAYEDTPLVVDYPGVLGNDVASDIYHSLCVKTTTVGGGSSVNVAPGGAFTFTPAANAEGQLSFDYTISEYLKQGGSCPGGDGTSGATVYIYVQPVNDKPSIQTMRNCGSTTVAEDSGAALIDCGGTLIDFAPYEEGQAVSEWVLTVGNRALFSVQPHMVGNNQLAYTPAPNAHGSTSISFRVRDNGGTANGGVDLSDPYTGTITILPVNDTPVAKNDSYKVLSGRALSVPAPGVLANDSDVDGNGLNAQKLSGPSHGKLVLAANGSFTYTPSSGYVGTDSFSYRAQDDGLLSAVGTVSLTVSPVPTSTPTPGRTPVPAPSLTSEPPASDTAAASLAASAPASAGESTGGSASEEPSATPSSVTGSTSKGGGVPWLWLLILVPIGGGAAAYRRSRYRRSDGGASPP